MNEIITISNDYSTDRVIDWCLHLGRQVKRINTDETIFPRLSVNTVRKKAHCYFRKLRIASFDKSLLNQYWRKELIQFWKEYIKSIPDEYLLGGKEFEEPARISTILTARKVGFRIPASLITTSKTELLKFLDSYGSLITKPLTPPINMVIDDMDIAFRVSKIHRSDVEQVDDRFYPTFFQQMIPRDYEVRLFYLKGKCWAMAFVVKKENEISPDIWNIIKRREVPIVIPDKIQKMVKKFMEMMGRKIGSLDFIISDQYWFFLELNPSGQYDFVSKNCNYFLDREIATLINS